MIQSLIENNRQDPIRGFRSISCRCIERLDDSCCRPNDQHRL